MRPIAALPAALALVLVAMTATGCVVDKRRYDRQARKLAQAQAELRKLQQDKSKLQAIIVEQHGRLQSLSALGDKRLEHLFHVQRIALGRHTGPVDLDGRPGDDAVKVYLRPVDQDGSIIKAAGDVKIQLFDLAADPKDNLIGQYEWTVDQIGKHWSSGFMTYHFSFACPWQPDPPEHDEITIRVEFTDYLTGKVLTAQKLCKVALAPQVPRAN